MFRRLLKLLFLAAVLFSSPSWAEERLAFPYQKIGEMYVAVWEPPQSAEKLPLLFFSHGSVEGCATQSSFLTQALAEAGYIVMAPNHRDATCPSPPKARSNPAPALDFVELLNVLQADPVWAEKIDFERIGFLGFSRGAAIGLGLGGGWGDGMPQIRAMLALAGNGEPFLQNGALRNIRVPVMYQVGTEDKEVMSNILGKDGAFDQTPSPAWVVENRGAAHFGWTDRKTWQPNVIVHYARAFFDVNLNGAPSDVLGKRIGGVGRLEVK